jgi:hypothetical protein
MNTRDGAFCSDNWINIWRGLKENALLISEGIDLIMYWSAKQWNKGQTGPKYKGTEVLITVTMKIVTFWDVTPCCIFRLSLPWKVYLDAVKFLSDYMASHTIK